MSSLTLVGNNNLFLPSLRLLGNKILLNEFCVMLMKEGIFEFAYDNIDLITIHCFFYLFSANSENLVLENLNINL